MGAAAGPIGIAMAAVGQIYNGIESNRAAHAASRVDDENSRLTILQGEQEVLQTRRDERRISGDLIAAMAGSGFEMGSGTAADLLAENAYQRELETLNLRTQRTQEANALRKSAGEKRKAGHAALVSAMFGAVSTAVGGAERIRNDRLTQAQSKRERETIMNGGGGPVPRMQVRG